MIRFQIRYDETLAKWQVELSPGTWSKPVRMPKLVQLLQSELVTLEEAAEKPSGHPSTNPRTYVRSPVRDLEAYVASEIASGRASVKRLASTKAERDRQELAELLDL